MQAKNITSELNLSISLAIMAIHILILAFLPLLVEHSMNWALLILPVLLLNVTHWALIHEGVHKHLNANQKANEYMSRGLSILMGASFHFLKFGHLMHHKLNRDWQCEIVNKNDWRSKLNHYFTLLGGLYLTEFLGTFFIALVPKKPFLKLMAMTAFKNKPEILLAGERFFYDKNNIVSIRIDSVLIALIYASGFYLYGSNWFLLAAFLIGRALVISFMDNIYHYDTAPDNSEAGKDLALPKYIALAFLNGNYHETHHLNSHIPWPELPRMQIEQQRGFDGEFIRHGLMQFKGPVVK